MKYGTHILVLSLLTVALTGSTAEDSGKSAGISTNFPIVYRLYMPQRPDTNRQSTVERTSREILEKFITTSNPTNDLTRTEHVEVELIPFIYAATCQRPLDLKIEAPKLGAFINYIVDGQITFQPDHRDQIPIQVIERALKDLCIQFGVTNAAITRGMAWRNMKSPNKVSEPSVAPAPQVQH